MRGPSHAQHEQKEDSFASLEQVMTWSITCPARRLYADVVTAGTAAAPTIFAASALDIAAGTRRCKSDQ